MLNKTALFGLVYFTDSVLESCVKVEEVTFENVVLVLDGDATPEAKVEAMRGYAARIGRPTLRPYTWESLTFRTPDQWHAAIHADWKIDVIVSKVENAEKVVCNHDEDMVEQRVLLGSLINPSGKYYVPFAISNIAGDCLACRGRGLVLNLDANKVILSRARLLSDALRNRLGHRYGFYADYPRVWQRIVTAVNHASDRHRSTVECPVCHGCGSKSAADDEAWREAFEEILKPYKMNLEQDENDSVLYVVTKHSPRETEAETEPS